MIYDQLAYKHGIDLEKSKYNLTPPPLSEAQRRTLQSKFPYPSETEQQINSLLSYLQANRKDSNG